MWYFFRQFLLKLFDDLATNFEILQMKVGHLSEFSFWTRNLIWSFNCESGTTRVQIGFEHISGPGYVRLNL